MASQPWRSQRLGGAKDRLKPVVIDPLNEVGLPSKGDQRLLSFKAQEQFFQQIRERCIKLGSNTRSENGLVELETALSKLQIQQQDIGTKHAGRDIVLMAMRKLREGLVASARTDDFAVDAYMFIIRTAISWQSFEAYQPALLHLLHRLHPKRPLSEPELAEFASYRVLDLACRLSEFGQAYVVRHEWQLKDAVVDRLLAALVRGDCRAFWSCRKDVTSFQASLVALAEPRVSQDAAQCLAKAYFTADRGYVESCIGMTPEELLQMQSVGWSVDGERITLRQQRGK